MNKCAHWNDIINVANKMRRKQKDGGGGDEEEEENWLLHWIFPVHLSLFGPYFLVLCTRSYRLIRSWFLFAPMNTMDGLLLSMRFQDKSKQNECTPNIHPQFQSAVSSFSIFRTTTQILHKDSVYISNLIKEKFENSKIRLWQVEMFHKYGNRKLQMCSFVFVSVSLRFYFCSQ